MNTKRISVGIFVIGGLALFGIGIFLIGDRHQLFSRHAEYYSEFVNLAGLANGANVRVDGMDAGQVTAIEAPDSPSSRFRVKWRIDEKLSGLVRSDSVATVATEGVVGGTYLAVRGGTAQSAEARPLATIPSAEPIELSDLLANGAGLLSDARGTLKQVSSKLGVTLDTLTATASNANDVVDGLKEGRGTVGMLLRDQELANEIRNGVTSTISDAHDVVADLKAGRGPAGMLLRDEALANQIRDTVRNAHQATDDINHAAHQADELVSDLNSRQIPQKAGELMDSLNDTARKANEILSDVSQPDENGMSAGANIRGALANANAATSNFAEATEALKHNFLVRGFFKKRGYYNLGDIASERYRRDRTFTRPTNRRVWLAGSDMFITGADGKEGLSERGKALLNSAVAADGDSIFDDPIVIEGYCDGPIPVDQLRLSHARALLVRQYLEAHFDLDQKDLGVVALKNSPPDGMQRSTWDGVCLVVLKKN